MLNRRWIFVFTYVSLAASTLLNYGYFQIGFGMFFYLPIFGFILLYPRWIVGITCCLMYLILRLPIELAANGRISSEFLIRLSVTTPITWFVILTVTFIVIKLYNLIAKMEYLSLTDNLTNAYNRRYLELYSEKLLAHSLRYNHPLCLLVLDIDHFKVINDKFGHSAGDRVLQRLTQTVQKTTRKADIFVRLGGEEFALLLPNTPLEEGLHLAERIRKAIQTTNFEYLGASIPVTASLGLSQYTKGSLNQLFDRADRALYQAKADGRNQVSIIY